jgi:MtN3 and saliva related transmembrane protein
MTSWFFIGIIAACLTMFGFIPQIARMYRTKSVTDISVFTLVQFTLGVTLWAVYGFSISDPILIGANIVSLTTLVVALVLYYQYQRMHREPGSAIREG